MYGFIIQIFTCHIEDIGELNLMQNFLLTIPKIINMCIVQRCTTSKFLNPNDSIIHFNYCFVRPLVRYLAGFSFGQSLVRSVVLRPHVFRQLFTCETSNIFVYASPSKSSEAYYDIVLSARLSVCVSQI